MTLRMLLSKLHQRRRPLLVLPSSFICMRHHLFENQYMKTLDREERKEFIY
jgi:hypothetical protein